MEHTPTPLDVFDMRLSQLRELYKDSPMTYAMVVRAVNAHEELVGIVKELYETVQFPGGDGIIRRSHIERMKQAIAKAEGK